MRFLVLQHIDVEHPGFLRNCFDDRGIAWDTVELDLGEPIPPLDRYDALLVFGGPMDVWEEDRHPWLIAEKTAIREWVLELRRPFLGICLGHQLLASALGSEVGKMLIPEVGIVEVALTQEGQSDRLFQDLPDQLSVLQWHGAEVKTLPNDGVVLASNPASPIQAFRVGRHAYGLQYHVEIENDTVRTWNRIPEYAAALKRHLGPDGGRQLERMAEESMAAFHRASSVICDNFQRIVATNRCRAEGPREPTSGPMSEDRKDGLNVITGPARSAETR
jgi:GMP synthase-like glutamine amidotransferase